MCVWVDLECNKIKLLSCGDSMQLSQHDYHLYKLYSRIINGTTASNTWKSPYFYYVFFLLNDWKFFVLFIFFLYFISKLTTHTMDIFMVEALIQAYGYIQFICYFMYSILHDISTLKWSFFSVVVVVAVITLSISHSLPHHTYISLFC